MNGDSPDPLPSPAADRAWAQVVVRRFAAATNLLVPGQSFTLVEPTPPNAAASARIQGLVGLLEGLGAFPRIAPAGSPTPAGAHVLVDVVPTLDGGDALVPRLPTRAPADLPAPPHPGPLHVLAPLDSPGRTRVLDEGGRVLLDPHDPRATADPGYGSARIARASVHMPITRAAVARLGESGLLEGHRVGLSLVLEPKTAVLALELAAAGAEVSVFGHAEETRTDVAVALREAGLAVFAEADADPHREARLADLFLAQDLDVLLDDGSHLIRRAHDTPHFSERATRGELTSADPLSRMIGAAEETTSGLRPLREWVEAGPGEGIGHLRIPVVASNDARSKTLFDNAYGTGQSCLMTILDLLDPEGRGVPLWERTVALAGYGDVGRGFARLARALGARVVVAEIDPVRALRARMDGLVVGALVDLSAGADLVVSATGVPRTVTVDVLEALPAGAVVAVAGGVEDEVALSDALASGATWSPVSRAVEDLRLPSGATVRVLDRGACINCTAGEGNPVEIMDLSFGVQVAALGYLLREGARLGPGLHPLPKDEDDAVAASALVDWPPLPTPTTSGTAGAHTPEDHRG